MNKLTTGIDFWAFYRDKDMFFIYKTEDLLGHPSATSTIIKNFQNQRKFQLLLTNNDHWEDISKKRPIMRKLLLLRTNSTQCRHLKENRSLPCKMRITAKQQFGPSTHQLFILATSDTAIEATILQATQTFKNLKSSKAI